MPVSTGLRLVPDTQENEILPWDRHHSDAYCKQKAESLSAYLHIHNDINVPLIVASGLFEVCMDFESCTRLNMHLASILPEKPEVCIIGDCVGVTGISCLNQIVPGKLYLVAQQNQQNHDVKNRNVNKYMSVASKKCLEYAGVSISTETLTYEAYEASLKSDNSRVSSHNSHPWAFLENLANSGKRHLHLLIYEAVWDKKVQEQLSTIQDKTQNESPEQKYNRNPDDIVNYLKFYQHETSPEEQVLFLDKFILKGMLDRGMTCDFIVITSRGKITEAIWQSLKERDSILAQEYTRVFQIEHLPNTKDDQMKYDENAHQHNTLFENHNEEPEDPNGGQRGRFFQYIFKNNAKVTNETCKNIEYKREEYYSRYFNSRDAERQPVYVKQNTFEMPCQRISAASTNKFTVLLEEQYDKLEPHLKYQYIRINPLRLKIEVQIEDLTFLSGVFGDYLRDCKNKTFIDYNRKKHMKMYIAQFEYRYKKDENIRVQSEDAQYLIPQKIKLFFSVHEQAIEIKKLEHWQMEPVEHAFPAMLIAMHTHKKKVHGHTNIHTQKSRNLQPGCQLQHVLSQLHELRMDWTLGKPNCTDEEKEFHMHDKNPENRGRNRSGKRHKDFNESGQYTGSDPEIRGRAKKGGYMHDGQSEEKRKQWEREQNMTQDERDDEEAEEDKTRQNELEQQDFEDENGIDPRDWPYGDRGGGYGGRSDGWNGGEGDNDDGGGDGDGRDDGYGGRPDGWGGGYGGRSDGRYGGDGDDDYDGDRGKRDGKPLWGRGGYMQGHGGNRGGSGRNENNHNPGWGGGAPYRNGGGGRQANGFNHSDGDAIRASGRSKKERGQR